MDNTCSQRDKIHSSRLENICFILDHHSVNSTINTISEATLFYLLAAEARLGSSLFPRGNFIVELVEEISRKKKTGSLLVPYPMLYDFDDENNQKTNHTNNKCDDIALVQNLLVLVICLKNPQVVFVPYPSNIKA